MLTALVALAVITSPTQVEKDAAEVIASAIEYFDRKPHPVAVRQAWAEVRWLRRHGYRLPGEDGR